MHLGGRCKSNYIDFKGFHSHIGSQIFEDTAFKMVVEVLTKFYRDMKEVDTSQVTRIVTLSTCAYEYEEARYVVLTVPVRVD